MPRLTTSVVSRLTPQTRRYEVMCASLSGFGVRVLPSGRKVFFCRYRRPGGRKGGERRVRIGVFGAPLTVDQAREAAAAVLLAVRKGEDPAAARHARGRAPTVQGLFDRYIEEHAVPNKKPASARMDRINGRKHVLPRLGSMKVEDVRREDVEALKRAMRQTPGAANRTIALLSKMFRLAEDWGLRGVASNPCRGVRRYPEKRRDRFLSPAERERLAVALDVAEKTKRCTEGAVCVGAVRCIRLLSLTGCRLGEIIELTWDMVDLRHECLRLPDSKTGQKTVVLGPPAVTLLRKAKRARGTSPFVCPNREGGKLHNIQRSWRSIRTAAGLKDVNLHALRHSFASDAIAAGVPLAVVGELLGHRSATTTRRYQHLRNDVLRQAASTAAATIAKHGV